MIETTSSITDKNSSSVTNQGEKRANSRRKAQQEDKPTDVRVEIRDFQFIPNVLTVRVGDRVSWKVLSANAEHVIRFIGEEEKEGEMIPFDIDSGFSHIFTEAGRYEYYCERHVFMRAEIIVLPNLENNNRKITKQETGTEMSTDVHHKYNEYVSKRQSAREKLAKVRANREEKNVPVVPEEVTTAVLIRFGSFDSSDDEGEETITAQQSKASHSVAVDQVEFGSFGNDKLASQEFTSSNDDIKPPSSAFDCVAALDFLNERWAADVNDGDIMWF
jgi:plastocyanin